MSSTPQVITNQEVKNRIEEATRLICLENQDRAQIIENLAEKKLDRDFLLRRLAELLPHEYRARRKQRKNAYKSQAFIYEMFPNSEVEERFDEPLSITTLCYKTQHGSKTLADEKRIFKEMRKVKKTGKEVVCDENTKIDQNQVTFAEIQEIRKQKKTVNLTVEKLKEELESTKNEIKTLEKSLDGINQKKGEIYESILELKRQNSTYVN